MTDAIPVATGDAALGPTERLHPLFLVTGFGKVLRSAWGLVAGAAVLGSQGRWWLVAVIAAGFIIVSIGSLLFTWLNFEYRVGADELRIDSGFLSRNSRAIPFDRVTDVDLEQGPLHRLFGLARVRLETGASAGAKNEDGVLDTIALARAEALRDHIRARRGRAPLAAAADDLDTPPMFAMDRRRVAIAGLFNFSLAVVAGLFGVTQTFGDVLGFDPFKRSFWILIAERSGPLQQAILAHQFIAVIGGALILILLGVVTGGVRTLLREHGFRLDRTEAGLRRRRGLLTLTDVTIPLRRVQATIVASGPIRRAFGWCELKLQSLAMDGARGDHVVAPLAHPDEARTILTALGWPAEPSTGHWSHVSIAYVSSLAALFVPASLVALGAMPWLGPVVLLWAAGALVAVAARWLGWRHTRYILSDHSLFIEHGWWQRRRAIVPTRNIQSIELAESFWTRAFGICTLRLGIAGGGGFSAHVVPALRRADGNQLRNLLILDAHS
ncbi:MAG: PH domain-containing protein [Sphingomonas bacterium]|nr:PH domain-containing protein [Sphingomonas bacterium]